MCSVPHNTGCQGARQRGQRVGRVYATAVLCSTPGVCGQGRNGRALHSLATRTRPAHSRYFVGSGPSSLWLQDLLELRLRPQLFHSPFSLDSPDLASETHGGVASWARQGLGRKQAPNVNECLHDADVSRAGRPAAGDGGERGRTGGGGGPNGPSRSGSSRRQAACGHGRSGQASKGGGPSPRRPRPREGRGMRPVPGRPCRHLS